MKKTLFTAIIVLLFFDMNSWGQNSSITFRSDVTISIRIKTPIDNNYNSRVIAKRIDLQPNVPDKYSLSIDSFAVIRCEYSDGRKVELLLMQGDSSEISYQNKLLIIKGNNASGNQYLLDNYTNKGLGYYVKKFLPLFRLKENAIDWDKMNQAFEDLKTNTYRKDLRDMEKTGKISAGFAKILEKDLDYAYLAIQFFPYENLLRGIPLQLNTNVLQLSLSLKMRIINKLDSIFNSPQIINSNTARYNYGIFFTDYLEIRYKRLNAEEKKQLLQGYDEDTFGAAAYRLLAPSFLHLKLFGDKLIEQIQNRYTYFDADKLLAYLTAKFPHSEYVPVISRMMKAQKEIQVAKKYNKQIIFLDGGRINSLKSLSQIQKLRGKRIFIDLWATWCMPCIQEFQYKDDLHLLLLKYGNIVPVYISLDDASKTDLWKKSIDDFQLNGYHLRASKMLLDELKSKVFEGKSLLIPRFVLLDTHGTILRNNLPRLSKLALLEQTLDETLKK